MPVQRSSKCGRRISRCAFFCALFALAPASAQTQSTNIEIDSTVVTSGVKRLGINLGQPNYYDSGQIMKNLIFRNPGFEGETYQSMIRCAATTATSCTDDDQWSAWPAGFWSGATFEFVWGAAKGFSGTVLSSTAVSPGAGITLNFATGGATPSPGDYLILRMTVPGNAQAGWWTTACCGAAFQTEFSDLPPGTLGKQALRLVAGSPGQSASVLSYFDTTAGMTFLQLRGTYQLSFKAKGAGGANTLGIFVARQTSPSATTYLSQTLTLPAQWTNYTLSFTANESNLIGPVQVEFTANGSNVLLDDVSLVQTDSSPANHTVFRDAVVSTLLALHPGVLRYWGGQLGETLNNQLTPQFGRMRAGYSAYSTEMDDIQYGLHDFLELCQAVSAEPSYVVPITFSVREMQNLIQYLAGPTSTPYGALRAALGHPQPWTTVFPAIHLEFGNEAWNSTFKGGNMEYPVPYGNRASELYQAARNTPGYDPARFDLVLGGQAVNVGLNQQIVAASTAHDTLTLAPYQMNQVDSYSTIEDLFGPTFAEPEEISAPTGYMGQNAAMLQGATTPTRLSVYEVNLNTVQGAISQAALDQFTPSLGAGLAVADNMLLLMRQFGAREQMLWQLPQYDFLRSDGKTVKLYGAVIDMGATYRRRPQYLALQMANNAVFGDMVQTGQSGANPTWDQPLLNGVQYNGAHYLQSYAFSSGNQRSVVIFNLSRTSPLPVTFSGPNAPSGQVKLQRLAAAAITANNESAATVSPVSQNLADFSPAAPLPLPPYSLTVLTWTQP
ncbi:MAG TPA: hypothetical protein VFA33_06965 [Bryobacteraceae bacterium]|nr:hypothetical protein [Bryobacteraceae bacterium]